ncbi:MAG: hypothetical protein MUF08_00485 [Burkholderiaceae bacterium]|jgi:hypothetical protein|nr:hypothetical protein [Burkholderiaceae bacterium]
MSAWGQAWGLSWASAWGEVFLGGGARREVVRLHSPICTTVQMPAPLG